MSKRKKKNDKFTVMCSNFTDNLEFAHFTLVSFAFDGKEMYQNVLCTYKVIAFVIA